MGKMITVSYNGKQREYEEGITVQDLVDCMKTKRGTSVWIDDVSILRAEYKTRALHDGEVIRIIPLIGGG